MNTRKLPIGIQDFQKFPRRSTLGLLANSAKRKGFSIAEVKNKDWSKTISERFC
ncbi:MAG: hypothetical protein IKO57_05010 [Treponema sp.]|nr:hypothetical protein [Treponema sp.]